MSKFEIDCTKCSFQVQELEIIEVLIRKLENNLKEIRTGVGSLDGCNELVPVLHKIEEDIHCQAESTRNMKEGLERIIHCYKKADKNSQKSIEVSSELHLACVGNNIYLNDEDDTSVNLIIDKDFGAVVGAAVGAVVGAAVGATVGAAIGSIIGHIYGSLLNKSDDVDSANDTDEKNPANCLGKEGYQLLIELELGTELSKCKYIKVDEEGNIVEIKNHDVGDGGVTVGIGIFVNDSYEERISMLKDLGVTWNNTDQWVPIDIIEQAFRNISGYYEETVNTIISDYNLSVSQSQYDALFLMAYNRPALFYEGGAVYTMLASGNSNMSDWREALINEYKQLDGWDEFGNGWTNRIDDMLELYFYGEYDRTHG